MLIHVFRGKVCEGERVERMTDHVPFLHVYLKSVAVRMWWNCGMNVRVLLGYRCKWSVVEINRVRSDCGQLEFG